MATRAEAYGITAQAPTGWTLRIHRRPGPTAGAGVASIGPTGDTAAVPTGGVPHPVLQACTRPIPDTTGDFGGGLVDALGPDDVFVALLEYGAEVADHGLFARQGVPRLAPSQFSGNRMPRHLPGMSASQHFFSDGGRAFCLYTVIGSHARRMALVPRADAVVRSVAVTDAATMRRDGGMP